jgi:uncharacterized protein
MSPEPASTNHEWFDRPDNTSGEAGLSFACTCCGACCSGPGGYVLFTDAEAAALALHLNISLESFYRDYTHTTSVGISLSEKPSELDPQTQRDCIFLDRTSYPGRAICGVYQHRPAQCRTWPFWKSNLHSPSHWARASVACPGMNKGTRYSPVQIRVLRDIVEM